MGEGQEKILDAFNQAFPPVFSEEQVETGREVRYVQRGIRESTYIRRPSLEENKLINKFELLLKEVEVLP